MSAVITPFQGTETFNTASFNNRISEINTGFSYVSNPNLLDNWYFANPVNQRGQTEYTGALSYTIDRWQLGDGNISLSVADGGIALKGGGVVGSDYIFTRVERLPVAKYTYTILFSGNTDQVVLSSKLTDAGVVTAVTSRAASGVLSLTWDQTTEFTSSDAFLRIHAPGSVNILAAKLELGSTQTLAHKEGERWVLNEVPDYGEQLRRCQRDYLRIKASSSYMRFGVSTPYTDTSAGAFIQFPNQMRAVPVLSFGGNFALFDGDQFHSVTLSSDTMSPYNATLRLTGSTQPTKGAQLLAYNDDNAYIAFSADL
nr:MAG TPA: hypothetical protein [Caudoviricetes sp.]